MSADKKIVDLMSRLRSSLPKLADIIAKDYRADLDAKVSILDLSYNALIVNVYRGKSLSNKEVDIYNNIYKTLIEVVSKACLNKTFTSLEDPKFLLLFNKKPSVGSILINNGKDDIFLVSKNFGTTRDFVTKYISKNPQLRATRFGEKTLFEEIVNQKGRPTGDYKRKTRSKVDIGHIPTENAENLTSPLESKLKAVLEYGLDTSNTRIQQIANRSLSALYNIQADIAYNFKNTAPEAIERAKNILGTGYLVLTLHTEKKNNQFSVLEKQIYDKLLAELALSINLPTVSGSNTIIEDIAQGIVNNISGKGKLALHKEQKGRAVAKVPSTIKVSTVKPTLPDIRHFRSSSQVSLTSLQNLINASLQNVISANMGDGSSRNILNYRTGRLAASASVERMSESRAGMITAFYTYMKNPYQTFEPGYAQGKPASRDPKLLISKSIREIAALRVGNRLRAVSI
jgi:hypothetical protein